MPELQSSLGGGEGETNGADTIYLQERKINRQIKKKGRCVMQADAINFETQDCGGRGKQTDSFCLEQEKRKATDRSVITRWEERSLSGY